MAENLQKNYLLHHLAFLKRWLWQTMLRKAWTPGKYYLTDSSNVLKWPNFCMVFISSYYCKFIDISKFNCASFGDCLIICQFTYFFKRCPKFASCVQLRFLSPFELQVFTFSFLWQKSSWSNSAVSQVNIQNKAYDRQTGNGLGVGVVCTLANISHLFSCYWGPEEASSLASIAYWRGQIWVWGRWRWKNAKLIVFVVVVNLYFWFCFVIQ